MKIGFIYGGQGSQIVGIGKDLYDYYPIVRDYYDSIKVDYPLKDYSFKADMDKISKTENTQGILLAFQIGITKLLEEKNIRPNFAMGLSLGEYSALYASGVLEEDTLMEIVRKRSLYMASVEEKLASKMFAIITEDLDFVKEICRKVSKEEKVEVSNINTRGQLVISGEETTVLKAVDLITNKNIRAIELKTSGPFHTSYMDEVSKKLARDFEKIDFKEEKVPIIYNYLGSYRSEKEDIKDIMSKQVNNPVLFKDSLECLLNEDLDLIIEIGYGNIIKGFIKKLNKNIKVVGVNKLESIGELLKEVEKLG